MNNISTCSQPTKKKVLENFLTPNKTQEKDTIHNSSLLTSNKNTNNKKNNENNYLNSNTSNKTYKINTNQNYIQTLSNSSKQNSNINTLQKCKNFFYFL